MDCCGAMMSPEYEEREAKRLEEQKKIAALKVSIEGVSITLGDLFGNDTYDAERFYNKAKLIALGAGKVSSPTNTSEPKADVEAQLFGGATPAREE